MDAEDLKKLQEDLAAPFEVREVKWKPQQIKNNRCMAIAYIDARLVMERLDDVVGLGNWQDTYQVLPDGCVQCRLKVRIGGKWIVKEDVGSPSEQPDSGDRLKAAVSDALKRAAVKFGIGRYLYRLGQSWVDYDPVKKQIAQVPQLPAFALPKKQSQQAQTKPAAPKPAPVSPPPSPPAPAAQKPEPRKPPQNGEELARRVREFDAKLAAEKRCAVGALISHVTQAGVKAGYSADFATWSGPAVQFGIDAAIDFEKHQPKGGTAPAVPATSA